MDGSTPRPDRSHAGDENARSTPRERRYSSRRSAAARSGSGGEDGSGHKPRRVDGRRSKPGSTGRRADRNPGAPRDTRGRVGARGTASHADGPEIPAHLEPAGLDAGLRRELRTLSKTSADRVSLHLQAAAEVLDDDPVLALDHARAARRIGARIAAVREAAGIAAYRAGAWQEALAELRTAHRMYGDPVLIPMLADCERALGRPERALELLTGAPVRDLAGDAGIERVLVEAGARRDLDQVEAARFILEQAIAAEIPASDRTRDGHGVCPAAALGAARADSAVPRLWYAYADTLAVLGRSDAAREWFAAVATADADETTDATDRAAAALPGVGRDDTQPLDTNPGH